MDLQIQFITDRTMQYQNYKISLVFISYCCNTEPLSVRKVVERASYPLSTSILLTAMHIIIVGILQNVTPKCLKLHFRDSRFQTFSRGTCPEHELCLRFSLCPSKNITLVMTLLQTVETS
jgi:hypothetical protein